MHRREFITLLGGAAAWPLAARAQQGNRVRRIGVLLVGDENDTAKINVSAFTQVLAGLGWTDGRNVRMDLRWAGDDINRIRAVAQELVGLKPDIIVAGGNRAALSLQQETRTIPIVFASVSDPVAGGLVARLDRPGGNTTGFVNFEASLGNGGKTHGGMIIRFPLSDESDSFWGWCRPRTWMISHTPSLKTWSWPCLNRWRSCGERLPHKPRRLPG